MGIYRRADAVGSRSHAALLGGVSSLALLLASGNANATSITLDGAFDSGYQLQYSVPVEGTVGDNAKFTNSVSHSGTLAFGIDTATGNQFLYWQLPVEFVENTYGDKVGHSFNDLLVSDAQGVNNSFKWIPSSGPNAGHKQTGTIDYLATNEKATGWKSGGFGDSNTDNGMHVDNDGSLSNEKVQSNTSDIIAVATSLQYDINVVDTSAAARSTSPQGSNPNWIVPVGYEIEFAPGTFDPSLWLDPNNALAFISLGDPHASPSMYDFTGYGTPTCIVGCTQQQATPIPSALPLFGGGLGILGWLARLRTRRKKNAPNGAVPSG